MTVRTLSEITVSGTPSESNPIDLDLFDASTNGPLADGDSITTLLTDIATAYTNVYVRAPSRSVYVTCDTLLWTMDNFVFLENASPRYKFKINHDPTNPTSTVYTGQVNVNREVIMWNFLNFDTVKIGGPNLGITLNGLHPGLGNGYAETAAALINFVVNDDSSPTLIDFRANITNAMDAGIKTQGGSMATSCASPPCSYASSTNRVQQVNIAGKFWNAGISINSGVRSLWYDPDRTVFSDPYNKWSGWDGDVSSTTTSNGRSIGCSLASKSQVRVGAGGPQYVENVTGGVTIEYGTMAWNPRVVGTVGTGINDPFIIRIKDYGTSGPGTAYTAGVTVRQATEHDIFKGDPHADYWGDGNHHRFVRIHKLPSTYGDGLWATYTPGCTDEGHPDSVGNPMRLEANDFVWDNHGWHVTLAGNWADQFHTNGRNPNLLLTAYQTIAGGRTWGHTIRLASEAKYQNATYTQPLKMFDTNTFTGQGPWQDIRVTTDTNVTTQANTIKNTVVGGLVTIDASCGTTTIDHVEFTGSATDLISVGAGSTVNLTNITIASGKRITGSGTATLDGSGALTLPYTFSAQSNASFTHNGRPNAPSIGSVS